MGGLNNGYLFLTVLEDGKSHSEVHPAFDYYYCDKNMQHEIYPLKNSLNAQHSIVNYKHNVVQKISRNYSSCIIEIIPIEKQFLISASPQPLAITIQQSVPIEYYSSSKKKEILPYSTTWINLKDIMPSEISQTQKDKHCVIPLL